MSADIRPITDADLYLDVGDERQLTKARARKITEMIKLQVVGLWRLIQDAYVGRAWIVLGYESWDAYCAAEFPTSRLRLPREERSEVVNSLRDAGLSVRAIEAATGVSRKTVIKDINKVVENPPPGDALERARTPILGADGKVYSPCPSRPQNDSTPRRKPITDEARALSRELYRINNRLTKLADDDRFMRHRQDIACAVRPHISEGLEVLGRINRAINGGPR